MEYLALAVDFIRHLDQHLNNLIVAFGSGFYGILFLIVFCETGLVVVPFLPGDSLLFTVGALAAIEGSPLNLPLVALVFFVAALCGDMTNYSIGKKVGPKVFHGEASRFFSRKHLQQTHEFFERHGGKTIIMARFIPVMRTFAPFVAGIGSMSLRRYIPFCIAGAALWIIPFLTGGYLLGNQPVIKTNFHLVVVAIIIISVMPGVIQYIRSRMRAQPVSN